MARDESKHANPNIGSIKTNSIWMDIKILDPEMETLMKEINEEQQKLKEALREKLKLMRYDTSVLQKENHETREWLRAKGVQFDDEKAPMVKEETTEIKIKEESIDIESSEFEYAENVFSDHTEETSLKDTGLNVSRLENEQVKTKNATQQQQRNTSPKIQATINSEQVLGLRTRRNVPLINYDEAHAVNVRQRRYSTRKRRSINTYQKTAQKRRQRTDGTGTENDRLSVTQ